MGKMKELNEFERGMIIGTILSGKSVAEAAKLLGFSRATVSRVYREWSNSQTEEDKQQASADKQQASADKQQASADKQQASAPKQAA